MAVRRVTSDNTIRYVAACLIAACVSIILGISAYLVSALFYSESLKSYGPYLLAGMFGVLGSVFSIVTRLQAFELRPCDESRMNRWMSAIRVLMGAISAVVLLLLASTLLGDTLSKFSSSLDLRRLLPPSVDANKVAPWQVVAVLGFIGGFAERFIPNVLRKTIDNVESTIGTPVQAVRSQQIQQPRRENGEG